MSKKVALGGDRLGSGNKMEVEMHGYGTSTFNLGSVWSSSMAPGTLVPFYVEQLNLGDSMKINLKEHLVRTLPTIGPVYSTFKLQMDVFKIPIRNYIAELHNNELEIGMDMDVVKLPVMTMTAKNPKLNEDESGEISIELNGLNQDQIGTSSLINYLGISGLGKSPVSETTVTRKIMAVPILGYWDIYKNYYANKQEGIGMAIKAPTDADLNAGIIDTTSVGTTTSLRPSVWNTDTWNYGTRISIGGFTRPAAVPLAVGLVTGAQSIAASGNTNNQIIINGTNLSLDKVYFNMYIPEIDGPDAPDISTFYSPKRASDLTGGTVGSFIIGTAAANGTFITLSSFNKSAGSNPLLIVNSQGPGLFTAANSNSVLTVDSFELSNIDDMRKAILRATGGTAFDITSLDNYPYKYTYEETSDRVGDTTSASYYEMVGLGLKTYQSDRFNNWVNTDWIDGTNGILSLTAIDTSDGSFNLDTLNLAQKLYNTLYRVAIKGGSYQDWQEAVWARKAGGMCEIPMYVGGASAEIVFNEVVSTADVENSSGENSLGTLAGRGTKVHEKGGYITITADEPCFVMGIVSITPRLTYSQGNKWWTRLETMNDLHKPELDGIGMQELLTDEMAAWDTDVAADGTVSYKSAGKQPAWIELTTAVDEAHGTFANMGSESFMILNRHYEPDVNRNIANLTTYVDPTIGNQIFAVPDLKTQNFWVFIDRKVSARRVMSKRQIPNL